MTPRTIITSELNSEVIQSDMRGMDETENRELSDYLGLAIFGREDFFEADDPAPYVVSDNDD